MAANIININTIQHVYKYIHDIAKHKNTKPSQILEPLSTIVRLGIISFKEVGTKIAINNNKLYIQTPAITQGVVRWTYGNNREEVHYLLKPITRALNLYNPEVNSEFRIIYECCVKGLRLLKKSYNNNSSTLCHALDLYITLIENILIGKSITNSKEYPNSVEYTDTDDSKVPGTLNISQNTKINLENVFKNIWKEEEITLIANMFVLALETDPGKKSYIQAIESILETKDKLSNEIISNTNKLL